MARWQKFLVVAVLALLLGLAARLGVDRPAGNAPGGAAQTIDFTLQGAGGPVSLSDLRGRVVLVNFGYTSCPDICPTVLANIAAGLKQLTAEEARQVSVVFISVDPGRDTPARLAEYTAFFHPAIMGVTGSAERIAEVAARYGAFYSLQKPDAAGNYVVDHSSEIFLVDRQGQLSAKIAADLEPTRLAQAIRPLL